MMWYAAFGCATLTNGNPGDTQTCIVSNGRWKLDWPPCEEQAKSIMGRNCTGERTIIVRQMQDVSQTLLTNFSVLVPPVYAKFAKLNVQLAIIMQGSLVDNLVCGASKHTCGLVTRS
ncbi:hypothetical protein KC19_7G048700 [Ceratodon purpureus]|uniref:Uncharacterized protein n=1 Tax=Ceratodon purpureus TaxID=3225 RepID=A0A8T0H2B2_CERPU|nr:hypothetical protein KC19_7G048700 [Ceratodon purpureus]